MGIELVGTRTSGITATGSLVERLGVRPGSAACIASAYWDKDACTTALEVGRQLGGDVRLLLWTAGASRSAWQAARVDSAAEGLQVRFIDSPEGGGIFHAKVAGVAGEDGAWHCALVGSMNLTAAALARNVELGVLIRGDEVALAQVRDWFDLQWAAATPAEAIDWGAAIAIAPERSEAAERKRIFAEAALAAPAPALPVAGTVR